MTQSSGLRLSTSLPKYMNSNTRGKNTAANAYTPNSNNTGSMTAPPKWFPFAIICNFTEISKQNPLPSILEPLL